MKFVGMRARGGLAGALLCLIVLEVAMGFDESVRTGPNPSARAPLESRCYLTVPLDGDGNSAAAPFRSFDSLLQYAATHTFNDTQLASVNIVCDDEVVDARVIENGHHLKEQSFAKHLRENESLHVIETRNSQIFYVSSFGGKLAWVRVCAREADHSTEWHSADVPLYVPTHVVHIDCKLRDDERLEFQMEVGARVNCLFELQNKGRTLALFTSGTNWFCEPADPLATARRVTAVASSLGLLR